jgi:uncharacterized membrane protein (UPF0127 family)
MGLLAGCSGGGSSTGSSAAATVPVTLPDGTVIRAEIAGTPQEHARGLMFRSSLPPDRGMIFNFPDVDRRPFWMFQTLIPLDIIWMDPEGAIVEISADTPPCESRQAADCRNYGGAAPSQYVLELAAGQAAAHGLKVGDRILF